MLENSIKLLYLLILTVITEVGRLVPCSFLATMKNWWFLFLFSPAIVTLWWSEVTLIFLWLKKYILLSIHFYIQLILRLIIPKMIVSMELSIYLIKTKSTSRWDWIISQFFVEDFILWHFRRIISLFKLYFLPILIFQESILWTYEWKTLAWSWTLLV